MSPLTEPTNLRFRKSWQPMDSDAAAYIAAVEAADGQSLEEPVKIAIDNFVLGCKADGIWNAIKASCILAGARTLNGALVPLKGTAPTNFNFVAGDYNRKTGLKGDGSTKFIRTGLNNNTLPRNSRHLSVYSSVAPTLLNAVYLGAYPDVSGSSYFYKKSTSIAFNLTGNNEGGAPGNPTAFIGCSRSISESYPFRINSVNTTRIEASVAPGDMLFDVFRLNRASNNTYSDARLAFYSIGESLDLALLDARVTDLVNAFGRVIA